MSKTLKQQIAWAQGRAAQARRLASRAAPDSAARTRAAQEEAMAEAIAASLRTVARRRRLVRPDRLIFVPLVSDQASQGLHS
ncbi:hypothetical protein [Brevundimonas subvibrioides]|uniref:Uncharacterized protein n=1 Tax=Brevundimonas subvibrioides (strain ATCC 15264 / DSM 4735 / LMG 14903 / NBRC 16000 / CB 81) TaxID=633149 RepID=D9QIA9_BRESC|nr:hypothetical protein [Brevundimonas subvibrioides]ADK99411.1 hypothetical protein Bresu_0097 [Brevundimonas subvibrioides ATCC 15264]